MAGFMGYGMTGGGVGIVSLKTGKKKLLTHQQVIPFHSTHTLKALPSGDLVGGTSVLTPGGGHAKDKEGVLYIMDWKTKKSFSAPSPFRERPRSSASRSGRTGWFTASPPAPNSSSSTPGKKRSSIART